VRRSSSLAIASGGLVAIACVFAWAASGSSFVDSLRLSAARRNGRIPRPAEERKRRHNRPEKFKYDIVDKKETPKFDETVGPFRKIPIEGLQIGQMVEGQVTRIFKNSAAFVDVGAEVGGMLEVGEWCDGFPTDEIKLRNGDNVCARILENDGERFFLTCRSGDLKRNRRKWKANGLVQDFENIPKDEWLEGQVQGICLWGCFIEVTPPNGGPPHAGKLHKSNFAGTFVDDCNFGTKVKVRVAEIDEQKNGLELTMKDLDQETTLKVDPFRSKVTEPPRDPQPMSGL